MNGKNSFIEKARLKQKQIELRIERFGFNAKDYFLFGFMVFFITGFMLFVYIVLIGVDVLNVVMITNPLLYLMLGVICCVGYLLAKMGVIT